MRRLWSFAVWSAASSSWLFLVGSTPLFSQTHPDDSCWRALGSGVEYPSISVDNVSAFAVFDGDLIVAGLFKSAGGVPANSVARWDGISWHPMGNGIDDFHYNPQLDQVKCLELHQGSLFAGGAFSCYDDNSSLGFVAEWNGASWQCVCGGGILFGESGCLNGAVHSLKSYGGSLYAGGHTNYSVVRWDGSSWQKPGWPSLNWLGGIVKALEVFNGKLVAGGEFSTLSYGYPYVDIVYCDSSGFEFIPRPGDSSDNYRYPIALCVYNGRLIAPWQEGLNYRLYAWDDTTWIPFSPVFNNRIVALTVHDGKLIAGGWFTMVGDVPASYIAEWAGEQWEPLGSGVNNYVLSLASWNGTLFVGGYFTEAAGQTVNCVAQWTRAKMMTVRDALKNPLANRRFHFIRVADNRPRYDEDTLGTFVTDSLGRLAFRATGDTAYDVLLENGYVTVAVGDHIKIARHVYTEPAVRHSTTTPRVRYSIHLDNGDFTDNGRLSFDTVAFGDQDIVLNHTEVRYNLLVSLEWDAAELYVDGLRKDFRQMSNYLYDVTDGQVRLDTVHIMDDAALWRYADVRVRASNVHRPDASVRAMYHRDWYPINMPRKWFANPDAGRRFSFLLHPLMDEVSDNYRTLAHEFGHYALGFHDEYECLNPLGIPIACCVPDPIGTFGFMEWQYDREYSLPGSSEMSSAYSYQAGFCRGTKQWFYNGMSCWDQFEDWMEDSIDGILVPILKPHMTDSTERRTGPIDYFPGPNDDLYNLDYDVGRLVRFVSPLLPPAPNVRSVRLKVEGVPAGGAAVWHEQTATGRVIEQGNTTDEGRIWALGVDVTQDLVGAAGFGFAVVPPPLAAASRNRSDRVWLSGLAAATADDSMIVTLNPVDGHFPFICQGRLVGNGWEYNLIAEQLLSVPPSVSLSSSSTIGTYAFGPTYQGYSVLVTEDTADEGSAVVRAVDNSVAPFLFLTKFKRVGIDTLASLTHMIGPDGDVIASLDTVNAAVQALLFLSSSYPVMLNGLPIDAVQVGPAHSMSIAPADELLGTNSIRLYYSESDLSPISGYHVDEEALQVHRWDSASFQWQPLESLVDTALNFASASITEAGVYTLFAVQYPTDINDGDSQGSLPYRFELSQNYPNPFNPVTTIEYSLPERSHVKIEIYNVVGQRVRTLVDRENVAGSYTVTWDGTTSVGVPVATGVYLYRFQAGDHFETKKMLLLK